MLLRRFLSFLCRYHDAFCRGKRYERTGFGVALEEKRLVWAGLR